MMRPFIFLLLFIAACSPEAQEKVVEMVQHPNDHNDPSSFTQQSKARIKHLSLSLRVDFDSLILKGVAGYNIEKNGESTIHFDIQGIEVGKVFINDSLNYRKVTPTTFKINKGDENGDDLEVKINDYTSTVHIAYKTKADSKALQWIKKEQTGNQKAAFLYTNGFSNHTRSWIPIQDSPGIRISYEALIKTPRNVMALMSADNAQIKNDFGEYNFFQENPVQPFLIALAVGDIVYNSIIDNLGAYADQNIIIAASDELEDVDAIMQTATDLYGNYQWKNLDFLVMPAAFPLGGMENPQLAFISPSLIAGDKSLIPTIVHEIAHAWTSSIVSNATWNDFWINEGFTVYVERRILEELKGKAYVDMQIELGYHDLLEEMKSLDPDDSKLKLDLNGRNPDEAFTIVPYEKGFLFLRELEKEIGREKMDAFLRDFYQHFAFQSITTEDFLLYLNEKVLQGKATDLNIEAWVYEPGLPDDFQLEASERAKQIDEVIAEFNRNGSVSLKDPSEWETMDKIYFIQNLPPVLSIEQIKSLDEHFSFSSDNDEIRFEFYKLAIAANDTDLDTEIEFFLGNVGRTKFVKGLFQAYLDQQQGNKEKARSLYTKVRSQYHPYTKDQLDELLDYSPLIPSDSLPL